MSKPSPTLSNPENEYIYLCTCGCKHTSSVNADIWMCSKCLFEWKKGGPTDGSAYSTPRFSWSNPQWNQITGHPNAFRPVKIQN